MPISIIGNKHNAMGPDKMPPANAQTRLSNKLLSKTMAFKDIQISFDSPSKGVICCHFIENAKSTPTLIIPTTIEGSKIWVRFFILEEKKIAAKPAKVKKRNVSKDRTENRVSNIAPITVVQVAAIFP